MAKAKKQVESLTEAEFVHKMVSQTPLKVITAVHVDTEGRRARFGSPPPPPGASPSLLNPTPGRSTASSATELMLSKDETNTNTEHNIYDAQLKPLVFEKEKSLTKYDLIKLRQWCFKFVPAKQAIHITKDTSLLSHWIILCGIRDVYNDSAKDPVGEVNAESEVWHSSFVMERKSYHLLCTGTGSIYELLGRPIRQLAEEKLASGYCSLFQDSIPENWVEVITAEARRRGLVRSSDEFKAKKRQKELQDVKRKKCERFFFKTSFDSPETSEGNIKLLLSSPEEACHVAKGTIKLSQKSIPREVRQLQSSKLGNLTMVQAAILEGLDGKIDCPVDCMIQLSAESDIVAKQKGREPNLITPIRSSSRARNTVSEWWKVGSNSTKKISSNKKVAPSSEKANAANDLTEEAEESAMKSKLSDDEKSMYVLLDSEGQGQNYTDYTHSNQEDAMDELHKTIKEKKGNKRKEQASLSTSNEKGSILPTKKHKSIEQFFTRSSPLSKGNKIQLRSEQPDVHVEVEIESLVAAEAQVIAEDVKANMEQDDSIEPPLISILENAMIEDPAEFTKGDIVNEIDKSRGLPSTVDSKKTRSSVIDEIVYETFYFSD